MPQSHLVPHVDLGEAEGAEVSVSPLHSRLDGLSEQLVNKLTDVRPHLFHCLGRETERKTQGYTGHILKAQCLTETLHR
jgi:hypothetical protein